MFRSDAGSVRQEVIVTARQFPYTDSGCTSCRSPGRVLNMTPAEEQQLLNTLKVIALDIKMLVVLVRELTTQQDAASQKAYSQLVNIAHRR